MNAYEAIDRLDTFHQHQMPFVVRDLVAQAKADISSSGGLASLAELEEQCDELYERLECLQEKHWRIENRLETAISRYDDETLSAKEVCDEVRKIINGMVE